MKVPGQILAVGILAAVAVAAPTLDTRASLAPLVRVPGAEKTNGYIVVLKDEIPSVPDMISGLGLQSQSLVGGLGVRHHFDTVLKGWSGEFDAATLHKIRADPRVAYVERDAKVQAFYQQPGSTYGLAISSQKNKLGSMSQGTYYYKNPAGKGVTVYVIDTGIYAGHDEFGGRAKMVANFVANAPNEDDHGHGTHCAGTIGGKTFGIAKNVNLAGIKVLDYQGSGETSNVITGINFAVRHCGGAKCVISMSLGGGLSQALNQAVENAIRSNIAVVAAAGNNASDACYTSPASAPNAVTVAAIDFAYGRADFSNYGQCADIFAPGVDVESAWIGAKDQNHYLSGTSMAAPHVAGIAATYIANGKASVANLTQVLINTSQKNQVSDTKGTPNRIANNGYWLA